MHKDSPRQGAMVAPFTGLGFDLAGVAARAAGVRVLWILPESASFSVLADPRRLPPAQPFGYERQLRLGRETRGR